MSASTLRSRPAGPPTSLASDSDRPGDLVWKVLVALAALGLGLVQGTAQTPELDPPHRLAFASEDALTGRLLGVDSSAGRLTWSYPGSPAPLVFDLETVSHVILRASSPLPSDSQPLFRLTLTNGDSLTGVIQGLDQDHLRFDIGLADALSIDRRHVHLLEAALSPSQLLYDGPGGPDEWAVGYRGKNWCFEDGHLISESYSSTGRELNIPAKARIELDVSLQGEPTLNVFLCADNPRNGGDSYYYLQLTPNIINFQRYWRDHPRTYINLTKETENPAIKEDILRWPQLRLAIEIDREDKVLDLFVNGERYAKFRDPAPRAPTGSSMTLASYGNGAVRAQSIRVYALDRLTESPSRIPPNTTRWRDGSTATGLLRIDGEEARVETGDQSGNLDNLLVSSLAPRTPGKEAVTRSAATVFLGSGGQLRGQLVMDADAGPLRMRHPLLGEVSLHLSLVDGFLAPRTTPDSRLDRVVFKNGDRLHGELLGWDNLAGLQWRMGRDRAILAFPPRSIAEIFLGNPRPVGTTPNTVRLTSSDELPGSLQSLSASSLRLVTPFSQAMEIPLAAVREVAFHRPEARVFRGPGALSDWRLIGAPGVWTEPEEGGLAVQGIGGAGRSLPLPDRGRLDLECGWTGQLDLSLTLFAEALDRPVQPDSYRIHGDNERVSIYRGLTEADVARDGPEDDPLRNRRLNEQLERFSARFGGGAARRLGSPVAVPFEALKRTRVYSLCWDRANDSVSLLVDGVLRRTWVDPDGLVQPRNGLILYQHQPSSTFHVLSLEIREWNGVLPEPPVNSQTASSLTRTIVRLRNQDEFRVDALTLENPAAPLRFESALGTLALPIDRLEFLHLPPRKQSIPFEEGLVADGLLHPEGRCRFFLNRIDEGEIAVRSPYFGENTLDLAVFRKLLFDLQDRAYWDRKGLSWPEPVPVSMRPPIYRRQANPATPTAEESEDQLRRFNESVDLDE